MARNRKRFRSKKNKGFKYSRDNKSKRVNVNNKNKQKNAVVENILNMIPRDINDPQRKQVIMANNMGSNIINVSPNNVNVDMKRMVSSKMYSSKNKNGKEEVMVDILSGITKDKKSRILRHFKVSKGDANQKPVTKYSTVLAKSDGKEIKVLESMHDGEKERMKKFKISNPAELKDIFSVQSEEIKGESVMKNMGIDINKAVSNNKNNNNKNNNNNNNNKNNNGGILKLPAVPDLKLMNKVKPKFNTMRKALRNSIQDLMKPKPVEQQGKKTKKNKKRNRNRSRGKRGRK